MVGRALWPKIVGKMKNAVLIFILLSDINPKSVSTVLKNVLTLKELN